jgi:hypothetical protein
MMRTNWVIQKMTTRMRMTPNNALGCAARDYQKIEMPQRSGQIHNEILIGVPH